MAEIFHEPISRLADALGAGRLSSAELVRAHIARIRATDERVRAFNSFDEADALAQAEASDKRRAAGESRGPLDGIPIGLKDIIAVKGQPLTGSSKILANYVSPYDATVTTNLKAAGAVLLGRLNMDEFAMGSSTENSGTHPTFNPWNLECVPGGSSGGSAAATATGSVAGALGTDTGGSIRQPASFCGVVGIKPSYGRVSRYGVAAFASSLDQVGAFARTVEDAAILTGAISGHDPHDSTSLRDPVPDYRAALGEPARKWRLGIPREYFADGIDSEVEKAVRDTIEFYRAQGCEIREVSLPHTEHCVSAYYIIATAECSSNLSRYDGVRYGHRAQGATDVITMTARSRAEGFGQEVKRRIILGTHVLSSGYYDAYYLRAQKVRTLIRNDFLKAFGEVDAILTPVAPTPAFKVGEKIDDPMKMYLSDIFTIGVNLAGLPAMSIPCGFSSSGLPIGLHLIGQPLGEAGLLRIAHEYERAHSWHAKHPEL
jgi:aspartyl-tRNA(Asn)/glutamyl-tRNA(Gln) amidotransferase subunit A